MCLFYDYLVIRCILCLLVLRFMVGYDIYVIYVIICDSLR